LGERVAAEVQHEMRDGVAVLTLDRPVANTLSPSVRADLGAALARAFEDEETRAIVLCGAGLGFSSGLDIAEYDAPPAPPEIGDLCRAIETGPKPVVAALHGSALGAGFELALAADARVAQTGTRVALPEVTLGLVPGGGGSQRLPRLVGAQAALEIMLSGQPVDVSEPRPAPLFVKITEKAPLDAALSTARALADSGRRSRACDSRRGFSDPEVYQKALDTVAGRLAGKSGAAVEILNCVEAALLLPFERGLEFERARFDDLVAAPQARGIRHIFVAERRAAIMPDIARARASPVETVVLAGAEEVLAELAVAALDTGQKVMLVARGEREAAALRADIAGSYIRAVGQNRLSPEARDERLSRLSSGATPDAAFAAADLVFDSGSLTLGHRRADLKPGAVWAVLDQSVPTMARAESAGAAGRCLSLRIYRPADRAKLTEIAVPPATAADAVATVVQYMSRGGRIVLRAVESPGMLGHNLMAAIFRASIELAQSGHSPFAIDSAAQHLGFARGPFQMMQADGLDDVRARLARIGRKGETAGPAGDFLAARLQAISGRGMGSGGFYAVHGRQLVPDPDLQDWLNTWRAAHARDRPGLDDVPLDMALLAAFVNEAARMIEDRAVQRASDIDVAMVRGYGFVRARGGPLLQADLSGLLNLVKVVKQFTPLSPSLWAPHHLVEDMVKNGRCFFGD